MTFFFIALVGYHFLNGTNASSQFGSTLTRLGILASPAIQHFLRGGNTRLDIRLETRRYSGSHFRVFIVVVIILIGTTRISIARAGFAIVSATTVTSSAGGMEIATGNFRWWIAIHSTSMVWKGWWSMMRGRSASVHGMLSIGRIHVRIHGIGWIAGRRGSITIRRRGLPFISPRWRRIGRRSTSFSSRRWRWVHGIIATGRSMRWRSVQGWVRGIRRRRRSTRWIVRIRGCIRAFSRSSRCGRRWSILVSRCPRRRTIPFGWRWSSLIGAWRRRLRRWWAIFLQGSLSLFSLCWSRRGFRCRFFSLSFFFWLVFILSTSCFFCFLLRRGWSFRIFLRWSFIRLFLCWFSLSFFLLGNWFFFVSTHDGIFKSINKMNSSRLNVEKDCFSFLFLSRTKQDNSSFHNLPSLSGVFKEMPNSQGLFHTTTPHFQNVTIQSG
mmetsp:Transcript_5379/g.11416  ORF Transcript_5379/g.11416 Transcript_5379/m.11416 type:complete len:438 (+) Transcript_5379:956-2269(+)